MHAGPRTNEGGGACGRFRVQSKDALLRTLREGYWTIARVIRVIILHVDSRRAADRPRGVRFDMKVSQNSNTKRGLINTAE